jgi:hypothetical protein
LNAIKIDDSFTIHKHTIFNIQKLEMWFNEKINEDGNDEDWSLEDYTLFALATKHTNLIHTTIQIEVGEEREDQIEDIQKMFRNNGFEDIHIS